MKIYTEHCYKITVPSPDLEELPFSEEAYGDPDYYCKCFIENIQVYDKFIIFTVNFEDSATRTFIIGKTNKNKIWYFDLDDYIGGVLQNDSDIEVIAEKLTDDDCDYEDEELLLISAALLQMAADYACSLKPAVIHNQISAMI